MFFCCGLPFFAMYRCGAAGTSSCVQRALLSTPRRWRGVLLLSIAVPLKILSIIGRVLCGNTGGRAPVPAHERHAIVHDQPD